MPRIRLVSTVGASEKAVRDILVTSQVVGVSCKGANSGSKGTIHLVVVAVPSGDVYAFDVRTQRDIILDGSLVRLFQSTDVIKVVHDCSSDAAALKQGFGVILRNVFDTQVAFRLLMEQKGLPPRMISREAMFDEFDIDGYMPSPDFQRLLREDKNVWARRPLNKDMLNTAAADVIPLVTVLYDKLLGALKPESLDWFECLCDKHRLSELGTGKKSSFKEDNKVGKTGKSKYELSVVKVTTSKPEEVETDYF